MSDSAWTEIAVSRAYDKTLPHWSKYQALIKETMVFLRDAQHVLDAGCGSGILAERIADGGAFVEGVDINSEMVRAAQQRARRQPGRLHFSCQDVNALSYANAAFDGIVSTNVVFTVREPRRYLTELHRVLQPGGRLAISGPTPQAPDQVESLLLDLRSELAQHGRAAGLERELDVVSQVNRTLSSGAFGWTYSDDEMAKMLISLGFDIIVSHQNIYDSAAFFVGAMKR